MRRLRAVPAGLVDSGFASLATFAVGLFAIWAWNDTPARLGIYALYMAAFLMASTIPTQVVLIPAERETLPLPEADRLVTLRRILALGLGPALAAASLISLATAVNAAQGVPFGRQAPLLATAMAAAIFAPLQAHARRLLHLAGFSWTAATVSVVQFLVATATVLVLRGSGIQTEWIPIGGLAIASLVSLIAAMVAADYHLSHRAPVADSILEPVMTRLHFRALFGSGRWLLGTGVMSTGNNLVVAAVISALAGQTALGLAEAARIVSQPMLVLANGLRSVLGPASMEAGADRDRRAARHVATVFYVLTATLGLGYALIVGFDWMINPFARFTPRAYEIGGLVLLTIVANGFNGVAFPRRLELIGANLEPRLFRAEVAANVAQLGVAVVVAGAAGTSLALGASTRALAFLALGLVRLAAYGPPLRAHYGKAGIPALGGSR